MKRSSERILITHTGSLPRPPQLTELYAQRSRNEAAEESEIQALGRSATREAVAKQLAAGIDIGNDGEQEREGFFLYVQHRMSGFGGGWQRHERQDFLRYPEFKQYFQRVNQVRTAVSNFQPPEAIDEVRYLDPSVIRADCARFQNVLDEAGGSFVEPFMTAPSPGIIAGAMRNRFYDSEREYIAALTRALRHEYEAIADSGFVLQLDCPDLALERHLSFQDRPLSDFLEFVETVIDALNDGLSNIAPDRVRLHVCWGNYEGPHDCDVPLAEILPLLLQANVGALVLPFANPRHAHEFKCFQSNRLGDEQLLIAGVIDSLSCFVEHPEVVADRLERVARTIGDPTRVLGGTDCGFDTSAGMGRVSQDIVWAKLAALRDGARIASERLL